MATTPMFTAARRGKPSKNRPGWVAVLGAVLLMMALRAAVLGAVRRSIARSSTSDGRATSTGHTKEAALRDRDEGALDEDDADAEEDKLADEEEEGLAAEDAQALYASNEKLDTEASLAELPHVVDDEALPRKHRRRRAPRLGNSEDVHSVVVGRQGATVIKERPLVPGAVRIAHKQSSAEQRQGDEVLSENFMRLSRGDQDGNDQDDQVANSLGGDGSTARMRQRRNSREDAERIHYRGEFGKLMEKRGGRLVDGESVIDSAAFMCKHMNQCDRFNAKVAKLRDKENQKKAVEAQRQSRRVRLSENWSVRVASMGSAFEECQVRQDDNVDGASTTTRDDVGSTLSLSPANAQIEAVRRCSRAVMKEMNLKDIDEKTILTAVTAHLRFELTKAMKSVVANEVGQLRRGGNPEDVQKKFVEAMTILAQKRFDEAEGYGSQFTADNAANEARDENGMTAAMRRAVVHSWRARNVTEDNAMNQECWEQMEKSKTRFLVTKADKTGRAVPSNRTTQETDGGGGSGGTAAASRCAMVTHLRQFLCEGCPVPAMGDLLSWQDVKPVLTIRSTRVFGDAVHRFEFPKPILKLLPVEDRSESYSSCAVVANSASVLRGSNYGFHIDSHDAVFRVNYAPTKGFEERVGERTTYDIVNAALAKKFIEGDANPFRLINSTLVLAETAAETVRRTIVEDFLRMFSGANLERSHAVMLSPDLGTSIDENWSTVAGAVVSARMHGSSVTVGKTPMSFVAAHLALQMCSMVHLYGFHSAKGRRSGHTYFTPSGSPANPTQGEAMHVAYEALRQMALWPGSDVRLRMHVHKG